MGSFDMACSVSGISLGRRQPTKLFFIMEDNWRDGVGCYPTDQYKFCSFGIDAKYDDYGYYKIDESQFAWQEFLKLLRKEAVHVAAGENPYHDREFDPKNPKHLEVEYLLDLMYHGRVRVNRRGEKSVHPWPVHKRVYDEVCLAKRNIWAMGRRADTGVKEFVEILRNEVAERTTFDEKKSMRRLREELRKDPKTKGFSRKQMKEALAEEFRLEKAFRASMRLDSTLRSITWEFLSGMVLINLDRDVKIDVVLSNVAEVMLLWRTLISNRIMVVPGMSAGQDPEWDLSAKFHRKCAEIAEAVEGKASEEFDEE